MSRHDREPLPGSEFYDDEAVFERYVAPRRRPSDSPVVTMEMPAFWATLGDVAGLAILDLGCGDGALGERLLARDVARYVGVDASRRMVMRAAGRLDRSRASVIHDDLTRYEAPSAGFDLVVSLRALHYVADLTAVLRRAADAVRPGGRVVYSHEHPVITSFEAREPDAKRGSWTVDNYFVPGQRDVAFLGARVLKYHRTVEQHLDAVHDAGLRFTRLSECPPVRELFDEDAGEYERRLRIPLFLLIEACRPEN
ncbi:MAG: class I SAM-dependent methyltransferase [Chloroflexi bacterium]|nr:class I SAM-dependent methyltransferase [Chloroflexota bacterium]